MRDIARKATATAGETWVGSARPGGEGDARRSRRLLALPRLPQEDRFPRSALPSAGYSAHLVAKFGGKYSPAQLSRQLFDTSSKAPASCVHYAAIQIQSLNSLVYPKVFPSHSTRPISLLSSTRVQASKEKESIGSERLSGFSLFYIGLFLIATTYWFFGRVGTKNKINMRSKNEVAFSIQCKQIYYLVPQKAVPFNRYR